MEKELEEEMVSEEEGSLEVSEDGGGRLERTRILRKMAKRRL